MKRIIFFHIPKTAGTSVSRFFLRQLPRKSCFIAGPHTIPQELARSSPKTSLYYAAHYSWDLYEKIDFRHRSFTFLRDPRKRLISAYYFVRHSGADEERMSEQARATMRYSLADWLQYCLDGTATEHGQNNGNDNFYTRIFLGQSKVSELKRLEYDLNGPELSLVRQRLGMFDCIGVVEDFKPSLKMISVAMGLNPPDELDLIPRNRLDDSRDIQRDPVTDIMEDAITELCQYDQVIYDYGLELYAQQQKAYQAL